MAIPAKQSNRNGSRSVRAVTEHDLKVAGDIGETKADIRTIKHELANVQQGMVLMNTKLDNFTNQQSRGLGFFAGAAFIVTTFGAVLIAAVKLLFVTKGGS